jgi:hypothetical protein
VIGGKTVVPRKRIPAGTKLPLQLSAAERRLIREETLCDDPNFCVDAPDKGSVVVVGVE